MHHLEVRRRLDDADVAAVTELVAVAAGADGYDPLREHVWLDLVEGGRADFCGLVAVEPGHDHPVGYAQLSRGATSWAVDYVVDPHHRTPGNTIADDLVRAAVREIAAAGGGHVHLWVTRPTPEHDRVAAAAGFARGRDLYQMVRPLPVEETTDLPTRPFEVGRDEDAWLEVNNRAFAWHPEQGGWDSETIKAREAEAWFDPAGFLLHEVDGELAGFCWTKVHADTDPLVGEIYVIAVDPGRAGRGLGRRLVVAGLHHLHGAGARIGMLYVDASNRSAVKLYVDLGFVVDHTERAYVVDVAPA